MNDRLTIACNAATALERFSRQRRQSPVLLGFDGFVDSIISVVDKRRDAEHYIPVRTIAEFGRKIAAAAGMSSNYEFVVKLEKLGGNGPIMANAMATLGMPVTYIGAIGVPGAGAAGPSIPGVHPVFAPLARIATCIPVTPPALTDAVEFEDGKLMLGKHRPLKDINWKHITGVVGAKRLHGAIREARMIGMVNWTMLPYLSDIWRQMIRVLGTQASGFRLQASGPSPSSLRRSVASSLPDRKLIFIDLADPEKRTADDLRTALRLCGQLQKVADVMLGLNLKEATTVAQVLGVGVPSNSTANPEPLARVLLDRLKLRTVIIHPRTGAAAAQALTGNREKGTRNSRTRVESATFRGPFVGRPKLSTGAGDNFNAGFCLGALAGLPLEQALCAGTAVSGYYVRHGQSPTLAQLVKFCRDLPEPQNM